MQGKVSHILLTLSLPLFKLLFIPKTACMKIETWVFTSFLRAACSAQCALSHCVLSTLSLVSCSLTFSKDCEEMNHV